MADIRAFCMPKWGIEMTEGTIAEWMIEEGDSFTRGKTLCLIETAKITNDVDAEYDAVARRILVGASGVAQPVGTLLAVFAEAAASDAEIDAFIAAFKPADAKVAANQPGSAPAPATATPPAKIATNRPISAEALKLAEREGVDLAAIEGSGRSGRISYQDVAQAVRPQSSMRPRGPVALSDEPEQGFASPLARRLAAIHGIDLGSLAGTGPRGRISKADVLAQVSLAAPVTQAVAAPFTAGENRAEVVPFDRIRKIVARRLTEAKRDLPHFYLRITARADALLALRKTANVVLGSKASLNDYLVKAVAASLVRHPDVNIQVHGEDIHRFPHADVAIAVASPKGLMTPIVRSADRMRIDQIATATRQLIDKANAGRLSFEDMAGGTFSVSNLGMFGIEQFDAIINPPQAAILAVGGITRQPVEGNNGSIAFESRIGLTLSVDHRAIDGAAGAAFLATLKGLIEAPEQLFA